ncbi:hypothetical protein ACWGR4_44370 [Embleya sp. NPDC055664]
MGLGNGVGGGNRHAWLGFGSAARRSAIDADTRGGADDGAGLL